MKTCGSVPPHIKGYLKIPTSSLLRGPGLLDLQAVNPCPFLSPPRSKTTGVWSSTSSLLATAGTFCEADELRSPLPSSCLHPVPVFFTGARSVEASPPNVPDRGSFPQQVIPFLLLTEKRDGSFPNPDVLFKLSLSVTRLQTQLQPHQRPRSKLSLSAPGPLICFSPQAREEPPASPP